MRLRSLTHLLESVQSLAHPEQIVVLGSSALLPIDPRLGETGQPLEFSYDADLLVTPIDPEQAAILVESLGQESLFSKRHGYYADILRAEIIETLPRGWESRLVPVPRHSNSFALNPYDLALVKLIIGRRKDIDLLHQLLARSVINADSLREHYQQAVLSESEAVKAGRNLRALLAHE
ncbi:MAG TPA: DUF6036 family nucleotidyltransferase [Verrucomicrobiae bacterium]|jgi:hypothetical protein|nr:DUF6036 family nucleotidyltransferase [Verrucomicrobiae bacterium]